MKTIADKEIKGEALASEDKKHIADMTKIYFSESSAKKNILLNSGFINENISGIKIMPFIYKNHEKRLIMAIGAVFKYQESRK
jgi:hypothetical protein